MTNSGKKARKKQQQQAFNELLKRYALPSCGSSNDTLVLSV
jgi:hypothetical protein